MEELAKEFADDFIRDVESWSAADWPRELEYIVSAELWEAYQRGRLDDAAGALAEAFVEYHARDWSKYLSAQDLQRVLPHILDYKPNFLKSTVDEKTRLEDIILTAAAEYLFMDLRDETDLIEQVAELIHDALL